MARVARDDRHLLLALGDAAALLGFALIGLTSHHHGIGAHGLFRDAVPVIVGWFAAAAIFGSYQRRGPITFLETWFVGITGGVLARGLVLHRHVLGARYLVFLAVTLTVTLLLLLAWRLVVYRFVRKRVDSVTAARNNARSRTGRELHGR